MSKKEPFIGCTLKSLPEHLLLSAAEVAIDYNPANRPAVFGLMAPRPEHLAVMTTKYWGTKGVKLTVGFPFDSTPADVRDRIIAHMNAWAAFANVRFTYSAVDPQVRISRAGDGYWSYLGTDVLSIPRNQPTMNLQGFTMKTPESEYRRVVRHETGHTLGFPHEHMRQQLVARLDRAKTISYFLQTQGWSQQTTTEQVLTPLSEASIMGSPNADQDSIMCYQLPGSITTDGKPINGGLDIDAVDQSFAAKLYPPAAPPPGEDVTITITQPLAAGTYTLTPSR